MKKNNNIKNDTKGEYFNCINCNKKVYLLAPGTKNRNHCPFCLYSLHIDNIIGDRESSCLGKMKPIYKYYKDDGEEVIVHKCLKCDFFRYNRIAGDDDFEKVNNLSTITIEELNKL